MSPADKAGSAPAAEPRFGAAPWEELPREMAAVLRPGLDDAIEQVIEVIRDSVPPYARPLEGIFGRGLRVGVERSLCDFVDLVEDPARERSAGVHEAIGRWEYEEGRALDSLLHAYRVGARVAWRSASRAARAAGYDGETLSLLAESIFAYIDELSAESADGYAAAQSAAAGERERRRRALVALLCQSGPPTERAALESAAADAAWPLPETVAALAWPAGEHDGRPPRLPLGSLIARQDEAWVAFVPDPAAPGRRAEMEAGLRQRAAALGPCVELERACLSAERALAGQRLLAREGRRGDGLLVVEEHLADLIVRGDPALVSELAERRLAPLDAVPEGTRERLAETLLAWLDHHGAVADAARVLFVHPQTVRYRLGRLREIFGDALEDPDARFELALALRGRRPYSP